MKKLINSKKAISAKVFYWLFILFILIPLMIFAISSVINTSYVSATKISNIQLPEGVQLTITDRDFVVATIIAPTIEVEETKPEEEEGEGAEEGAEEGEGAESKDEGKAEDKKEGTAEVKEKEKEADKK